MRVIGTVCVVVWALNCGLPESDYFGRVSDFEPNHFRWCNSGEPEYVDPALTTSTTGVPIARLLFAGLADQDIDFFGTAIPGLAESWEVAPDQRKFTFHLRDARWSNGRPIVANDFVYHVMRILHPTTSSRNTSSLDPVKNAVLYNGRKVKMVTGASGGFAPGDVVEVVGLAGSKGDPAEVAIPDSNIRVATKGLKLRDLGADEADAYATVPAGGEVELIELGGTNRDWAYVFYWPQGWEKYYGWVPLADLDVQPHGDVRYRVREVARAHRRSDAHTETDTDSDTGSESDSEKRREGVVAGADLLMLPDVLGIYARDDKTLVIETWGPMPYFISQAMGRTFRPTPRESVSRAPEHWTRPDRGLLVTSGPFSIAAWRDRDRIELVRSGSYYDDHNVKLDRITVFSIDDQAASTNSYMQGRCDALSNIPFSFLPALTGKKTGKPYKDFRIDPYLGIYYYVVNTEKFANVHFRRALSYAANRAPLPNILHGQQVPSASFLPGQPVARLSPDKLAQCGLDEVTDDIAIFPTEDICYLSAPGLNFDLAKAKHEWELAKKQMGAQFPKSITIKFNSGVDSHKIIAEFMQKQWSEHLGIEVTLASQEWKTYLKDTASGKFEIARMGWVGGIPDPESDFLLVFKCGSPYNRSRWCSKEFDSLFALAESTTDRRERYRILRRAEELMIGETPIIPLYIYTQQNLIKPYVRDHAIHFGGNPPLHRIWLDPNWKSSEARSPSDSRGNR